MMSSSFNNEYSTIHLVANDIIGLATHTCHFNLLKGCQSIFSSKEWLLNYASEYAESNILLLKNQKCSCGNYIVLERSHSGVKFLGSPYNDINFIYPLGQCENICFHSLIESLLAIEKQILLENLSISDAGLISSTHKITQSITPCVAIRNLQAVDVLGKISKKVTNMRRKLDPSVHIFGIHSPRNVCEFNLGLSFILENRLKKLTPLNISSNNESLNKRFSKFITNLCSENTLNSNVLIGVCKKGNEIVAASLFFVKDKEVLYYLRSHLNMGNNVSYGLVLDYWCIEYFISEGFDTIDYTRGTESYKYRLGGDSYNLINLAINEI